MRSRGLVRHCGSGPFFRSQDQAVVKFALSRLGNFLLSQQALGPELITDNSEARRTKHEAPEGQRSTNNDERGTR